MTDEVTQRRMLRDTSPEHARWIPHRQCFYFEYTFRFQHDGKISEYSIWAKNREDAQQKLDAIKATAVLGDRVRSSFRRR